MCKNKVRLETLNEVCEKFLDFTLAGNEEGFEAWLRRETLAVQCAVAVEPQDKCNCNIGCGDHHAAQCAVWIEPARCKDCDVTIEDGICDCIGKNRCGA